METSAIYYALSSDVPEGNVILATHDLGDFIVLRPEDFERTREEFLPLKLVSLADKPTNELTAISWIAKRYGEAKPEETER